MLLKSIAGQFDAFVTVDANLAFQQNMKHLPFGIIALRAPSNKIEDLRPLVPRLVAALENLNPGQIIEIFA